jgi:hypothetical protein
VQQHSSDGIIIIISSSSVVDQPSAATAPAPTHLCLNLCENDVCTCGREVVIEQAHLTTQLDKPAAPQHSTAHHQCSHYS